MTNSDANTTEKGQKVDTVKATNTRQPSQSDQVKEKAQEMLPTSVDTAEPLLLALPPEIRHVICTMVVEDMPDNIDLDYRSLVQSNLCQPELAKVNRQFRREVLPIFYEIKRFVIRIQPENYSYMNPLWRTVFDRFIALSARVEGPSHLSRIQHLDVELWDQHLKRYPCYGLIPTSVSGRENFEFYNRVTGGIYLQFGPETGPGSDRSEGQPMLQNATTNFLSRNGIRDWLQSAISLERRVHDPRQVQTSFWPQFPLELLLDLAMMVGTNCEATARQVCLGTCFVDLGWVGNDRAMGLFAWQS